MASLNYFLGAFMFFIGGDNDLRLPAFFLLFDWAEAAQTLLFSGSTFFGGRKFFVDDGLERVDQRTVDEAAAHAVSVNLCMPFCRKSVPAALAPSIRTAFVVVSLCQRFFLLSTTVYCIIGWFYQIATFSLCSVGAEESGSIGRNKRWKDIISWHSRGLCKKQGTVQEKSRLDGVHSNKYQLGLCHAKLK